MIKISIIICYVISLVFAFALRKLWLIVTKSCMAACCSMFERGLCPLDAHNRTGQIVSLNY